VPSDEGEIEVEFYNRMAPPKLPSKWVSVAFPQDNTFTTLKRLDFIHLSVIDNDDGGVRVNYDRKLWE
jgi:hypothetical protein